MDLCHREGLTVSTHHIAFWNVENLFDVRDSPRCSEKLQRILRSELAGWTQDLLETKIGQLAAIIRQLNDGKGPDLLDVREVENLHVEFNSRAMSWTDF